MSDYQLSIMGFSIYAKWIENFRFADNINSIPAKTWLRQEKINYKMMRKPSLKVYILENIETSFEHVLMNEDIGNYGKLFCFQYLFQCDRPCIECELLSIGIELKTILFLDQNSLEMLLNNKLISSNWKHYLYFFCRK